MPLRIPSKLICSLSHKLEMKFNWFDQAFAQEGDDDTLHAHTSHTYIIRNIVCCNVVCFVLIWIFAPSFSPAAFHNRFLMQTYFF